VRLGAVVDGVAGVAEAVAVAVPVLPADVLGLVGLAIAVVVGVVAQLGGAGVAGGVAVVAVLQTGSAGGDVARGGLAGLDAVGGVAPAVSVGVGVEELEHAVVAPPSQSSSMPLQASLAPGWTAGSESSQSSPWPVTSTR
jgi:hypothetical protein